MSKHSSHPEIVNRLKRAAVHLQKLITMMEENCECLHQKVDNESPLPAEFDPTKSIFSQEWI